MEKYKLFAPQAKERNKFIVTIVADSNDADYITEISEYSSDEFNDTVVEALIELKNRYSGYHRLSDCPLSEHISIPFNGHDGLCHTLESVKIKYIDEKGFTWNVELS